MKLLYLTTWDFSNEEADGVCKKIYSHISTFEKNGYLVDFIYIKDKKILYRESGNVCVLDSVGSIKKIPAYIKMYKYVKDKKYDWVYNRYGMMDTFYYRVLKRLKRNGARILIEIPTYPYVGEKQAGLLYAIMFKWDDVYLKKLKKIVERIVTYSQDKEIWGIETIQIMNGIDCESIRPVEVRERKTNTINLIFVALMQPYHGFERLLYGLKEYYDNGGKRDIVCHMVGDGPEKTVYEKLVKEMGLEKQVIFYGRKGGEELEKIYGISDIGVSSLGCYKKKLFWASELKSKEYLARGVPFITGMKLDITAILDKDMFLEFPNDDSIIEIEKVLEFYDKVYSQERREIINKLRSFAEKNLDISKTMFEVIERMENG